MKKTIIIYGSSTGTCESIAQMIGEKLGVADVVPAADITADKVAEYDNLILGSSTWGDGELQDDWYDAINEVKAADLSGKTIAIFGCGDSESYSDTFCDAIGLLYAEVQESGANLIGAVSAEGYNFSSSNSVVDGIFVGLALDDVNESDLTEQRVDNWIASIKDEL